MYFQRLKHDVDLWCAEQKHFWPWVAVFVLGLNSLRRIYTNTESWSIWNGINLGIHELGHVIFSFGGEFLSIAGGSLAQVLLPLYGVLQFIFKRDYFSSAFCFVWLGESLFNLSRYVADATLQVLPLVTPFGGGDGEIIHDWHYMLSKTGLLNKDVFLGSVARWTGFACVVLFLATGYYMLDKIYAAKDSN